jgi:hypothetical protein
MKRPVGLILSAIALGFVVLGLLLLAALMGFAGFFTRAHPTPSNLPPFMMYFMYGMGFLFAAQAAWAASTVVGLIFLRSWARYSILVIGGLMAVGGAVSIFGLLAALLGGQSLPPGTTDPVTTKHIFHIVFAVCALGYGVISAVGVWWLIYFTRRTTRERFGHRLQIDPSTGLILPPPPPARRPTAITVLGYLILIGSVGCALCVLLPFPAFFLGFILPGWAGHALYIGLAITTGLIGIFLLRLHPVARIAAISFLSLGCVNTLMGLLPWYQQQFRVYTQQFMTRLHLPANVPPPSIRYPAVQMAVYGIMSVVLNGFLIWLLHRHRTAFNPPPPVPSLPEPL